MDIPNVDTANDRAAKPRYGSESNSVPYSYPSPLLASKPLDQCDTLRDNWRRVWESSVTSTSDHFSFKNVFLQQFTGQSLLSHLLNLNVFRTVILYHSFSNSGVFVGHLNNKLLALSLHHRFFIVLQKHCGLP